MEMLPFKEYCITFFHIVARWSQKVLNIFYQCVAFSMVHEWIEQRSATPEVTVLHDVIRKKFYLGTVPPLALSKAAAAKSHISADVRIDVHSSTS